MRIGLTVVVRINESHLLHGKVTLKMLKASSCTDENVKGRAEYFHKFGDQ